jgi:tRNA nucleotidyltransferase (CCA-adding enzyme)
MAELREQIEALPGMDVLLPALQDQPRSFLVGGAVRDLLRGVDAVDLDLAVEGDAPATARAIAERLGGEAVEHDRFGTATLRAPSVTADLATTRRESYPAPGALPEVEPAPIGEDLSRRDFSVNAMAAGLTGDDLGVLHDPHGGRADLEGGIIRILHSRSFVDDPTRVLRAIRYEVRLGAKLDPITEELALTAIATGALRTVSGTRIREELVAIFNEQEMPAIVARISELRLDRALWPCLMCDPDRSASTALAAAETGADRVLALFATMIAPDADACHRWLDRLGFHRHDRDRIARAAATGPHLSHRLEADMKPSELYRLLHVEPLEALALALAFGAPGEAVLRYLTDVRNTRLAISGGDLIASGVPESPAIGEALEETLLRKLDGEVDGRDEELKLALDLARARARA